MSPLLVTHCVSDYPAYTPAFNPLSPPPNHLDSSFRLLPPLAALLPSLIPLKIWNMLKLLEILETLNLLMSLSGCSFPFHPHPILRTLFLHTFPCFLSPPSCC